MKNYLIKAFLMFSLLAGLVINISCFKTKKVYAHGGDYYSGSYDINGICNPRYIKFKVMSSAITASIPRDYYDSVYAWNGISSNVSIGRAFDAPGVPYTGFNFIKGIYLEGGVLGYIEPHLANGDDALPTDNWYSVSIYINKNGYSFNGALDYGEAVKKTIIHEIGHSLMLSHPIANSYFDDHCYSGGLPRAVMNQGFPDSLAVSSTISSHDIMNLIAKWGA